MNRSDRDHLVVAQRALSEATAAKEALDQQNYGNAREHLAEVTSMLGALTDGRVRIDLIAEEILQGKLLSDPFGGGS